MRQVIRETFWALSLSVSVSWLDLLGIFNDHFRQVLRVDEIESKHSAKAENQTNPISVQTRVIVKSVDFIVQFDDCFKRIFERYGDRVEQRNVVGSNVETVGKEALGFEIGEGDVHG
jgi:hypothetical protein